MPDDSGEPSIPGDAEDGDPEAALGHFGSSIPVDRPLANRDTLARDLLRDFVFEVPDGLREPSVHNADDFLLFALGFGAGYQGETPGMPKIPLPEWGKGASPPQQKGRTRRTGCGSRVILLIFLRCLDAFLLSRSDC